MPATPLEGAVAFDNAEPMDLNDADEAQAPEEEQEGIPIQPMRFEPRPTPEMVEQHNISHISFRSWCPFCVRGRGTTFRHQHATGKDEEQLPAISVDYGFMGNPETRADQLPIMVIKDRTCRGIWAHPAPSKGPVDPYGCKRLVSTLDGLPQDHP